MNLLINFSRLNHVPIRYIDYEVIDVTNSLDSPNKISIIDIFNSDTFFHDSLRDYYEFIDELISNEQTLNIKIDNFSLFWISKVGLKHPTFHWGKDFHILLNLLRNQSNKLSEKYEKIIIIVPERLKVFFSDLGHLFNLQAIELMYIGEKKSRGILRLLKSSFHNSYKVLMFKNSSGASKKSESTNYWLNSFSDMGGDFKALEAVFLSNGVPINEISLLEWQKFKNSQNPLPVSFFSCKPQFGQLVSLMFKSVFLYSRLLYARGSFRWKESKCISLGWYYREIRDLLIEEYPLLISKIWLDNFLSSITYKANLFYQNEFYQFGRVVSHVSRNNKLITTYGLQHGFFNEIHTVYHISEVEVLKSVPLPSYFVVWGEFFKNILQTDYLKHDFCKVLGNPKYLLDNFNSKAVGAEKVQVNSILWCTTTYDCFVEEFKIIRDANVFASHDIQIRLHPKGHVTKKEVDNLIKGYNYSFNQVLDFNEAVQVFDLVIVSAHSTSFIDGLLQNKSVVRLITNRWMPSKSSTIKNVFLINNSSELSEFMNNGLSSNEFANVDSYFLCRTSESWNNLISNIRDGK